MAKADDGIPAMVMSRRAAAIAAPFNAGAAVLPLLAALAKTDPAFVHEGLRIDLRAAGAHFEVEVTSARSARIAHLRNSLTSRYGWSSPR